MTEKGEGRHTHTSRTGQDMTGHDRTTQDRTGQDMAGQDRTTQGRGQTDKQVS